MKTEIKTAIICGIIIIFGFVVISIFYNDLELKQNTGNNLESYYKSGLKKAPDILEASGYINISQNEFANTLKGNVVLYDIWTYSCINCIRTLPYITAWDEKYKDQGLIIVGIHTPEFEFEKNKKNVLTAVEKFAIKYPVVLDNEKEIWNAFQNNYWPRKYIADHNGYIRYDHIGEGSYKETEKVIQKLLQERSESLGIKTNNTDLLEFDEFKHSTFRTPEIYFGYHFATDRNQIGNNQGFNADTIISYEIPLEIKQHYFYLDGTWENKRDSMKLISSDGSILLKYNAKQVNIVASNNSELEVFLDGDLIPNDIAGSDLTTRSKILVSEPRLYNIIDSVYTETHELKINVKGANFEIFTFTFG